MNRNILYCLTIVFLVTVIGCAEKQTVRRTDGKLIAPIENYQVALMPDFRFLGKVEAPVSAGWKNEARSAQLDSESLVYVQAGSGSTVEKALIARTYQIRGGSSVLIPGLDFKNKALFESRDQKVASKNFSYAILIDSDLIAGNEKKLINSRGLSMSDCYLVKAYSGKLTEFYLKSRSHILYIERILDAKAGKACSGQVIHANDPHISDFSMRADKYLGELLAVKDSGRVITGKPIVEKQNSEESADKSAELAGKLSALKELMDKGLITQEDYNKQKLKLLESF